jgi:hypothetical protein
MKAIRSCETSVTTHPMTGCRVPKTIMLKISLLFVINDQIQGKRGSRGGAVVKALSYKPAGRGFDSRWCHWNFSVT